MTFEELYAAYSKQVFNLALQYVQNKEDAQEITQDVFVAVHQSLATFQGNSELSTWMYRIAIHKSLDFLKARKRKKRFAFFTSIFAADSVALQHDKPEFNHPGVQLEQKEALQRIFEGINTLPPNQQTALILSKIEGKSQHEIAAIMELSPKAVESLVQRAKTTLQIKLKRNEGNE